MEATQSIDIARPIEDVFTYTLENVADWSLVVVEDELVSGEPHEIGSTFRNVCEERGRRMEFLGTVTDHEFPTRSACHLEGSSFDIDVEYRFEDLGEGRTRVHQHSRVHPRGFLKIFFLFGWAMKKSSCEAALKELESLKSKLEASS